ncbi:hypothetical protein LCGC14_1584860 [marine sediment metagenome]|uniref:Uncharacterized protein n=1 Tax=marine sediment metagenome TaxID=412755 RepID=A0A0F9KWE7_9ZZZZ
MSAYRSHLIRCGKQQRFPLSEQEFVDTLEEAYAYHKMLWTFIKGKKATNGILTISVTKQERRLLDKVDQLDRKLGY